MARPYRLQAEDCFYHITSRGNSRKKIFLNNTDFEKFLEYILKAKEKYDFYLLAYVLMSNHYHLLIKTTNGEIGKIFKMKAQAVSKAGNREVDGGAQEDKESGEQANFYFRGLIII